MTKGITVNRQFHVRRGRNNPEQIGSCAKQEATAVRPPRISRLVALAIHFDQLIRDGVVHDQAELARIGQVSRARLTQILNLAELSPEIQEAILLTSYDVKYLGKISERSLRPILNQISWDSQRNLWVRLLGG